MNTNVEEEDRHVIRYALIVAGVALVASLAMVLFATLRKPPYTDAENESNAWFRHIARDAGTEWELDESWTRRTTAAWPSR